MAIKQKTRSASALVDLLVGVLCLIILASLAMPYLLQLRTNARMEECSRKLRQICLAAHNFHDSRKRLPPATLGLNAVVDSEKWADDKDYEHFWSHGQYTSSLAMTQPYMGMARRYDMIPPICYDMYNNFRNYTDASGNQIYTSQEQPGDADLAMVEVEDKFLCPEDNLKDHSLPAITAVQPCKEFDAPNMEAIDGCRDLATRMWPDAEQQLGLTNYVGCIGVMGKAWSPDAAEMNRWQGAMAALRKRVKLEEIADGTSRTIMYGESLGEINDGERTAAQSWLWAGAARITGHLPYGEDTHPDHLGINMLGNNEYSSVVGFSSNHPDVVFFALCDGSVCKISKDIDREVLYQLAGARDGGTPTDFIAD